MEYGPVRKLCGDALSDSQTSRELESSNLPAVFVGGVGAWPAISRWDPAKGGLHHLKSLAGSTIVQGITSNSSSAFYGHIRGHDRVPVSFGGFIDRTASVSKTVTGCGLFSSQATAGNATGIPARGMPIDKGEANIETTRGEGEEALENGALDGQLYLAQGLKGEVAKNFIARVVSLSSCLVGRGTFAITMNMCNSLFAGLHYLEDKGSVAGTLLHFSSLGFDQSCQVPIFSKEAVQETTLSPLMQDIEMPLLLRSSRVSDINLWMSMTDSRSSTHYDPYHNLLCVVAGEKTVTLWPPSAAPFLYPLPINGEASNHSGVDFVQPDYKAHPLFRKALRVAQLVLLHRGDALFIPEGWYHQVDNSGVTIAVNFWWPSKVSLALGTHMDAYFLRRVLVNLVDLEKDRILGEDFVQQRKLQRPLPVTDADNPTSGPIPRPRSGGHGEPFVHSLEESEEMTSNNPNNEQVTDQSPKKFLKFEDLTALETYHLNCLVESLSRQPEDTPDEVSEAIHSARQSKHGWQAFAGSKGPDFSDVHQDDSKETSWEGVLGHLQMDSVARVFSTSKAVSLQRILLVMANHFPRMLETLMLTSLSPSAAEILTRKFEELDASTEKGSQGAFYEQFYGSFESPDVVMEALLKGKEAFAAQALRNVLTQFLSIDCTHSGFSS